MSERRVAATLAGAAGIAAGALALGALGAVAVGGALARFVVTPARHPDARVRVERIEELAGVVVAWLRGPDADLPGRYSFIFGEGSGHARLGDVVERRSGAVARPVHTVDRGSLAPGVRGRVTGWWFTNPAELGFSVERIRYRTELGEADAWLVRPKRARKKRWAVHVHGRGASPEEALRGVAPLARAGVTSLVITYRNDAGAPSGANGRYGVGLSEGRDVDAAITEATRRGAERVTLFGWSMGGTACLVSATQGRHAALIDGLILDSPAVDWPSLLRHQAGGKGMPGPIADIGIEVLSRGWVRTGEPRGIPVGTLTPEHFARALTVPVLIHAGAGDTFVPPGPARRLARLRPELVELIEYPVGEHVKLWNVEPEPWERTTERFARSLPRPAWRG